VDLRSLKSVTKFYIVQADGSEEHESTLIDEKEFGDVQEAIKSMKDSEAPIKYLKFNFEGMLYKLYPTSTIWEYRIVHQPILH
jgi:hypothetical protein